MMRFDWFLHAIRKTSDGEPAKQTRMGRFIRRCLPPSLRSNHKTKMRGLVRRALRSLGSSWLYSPIRRFSQTLCFASFVWLFFYVCWPYTAAPATEGRVSVGWQFSNLDQVTGHLILRCDDVPEWVADSRKICHLADDGDAEPDLFGGFAATRISDEECSFTPTAVDAELIERMLTTSGSWSVYEFPPDRWPSHYADDLEKKEFVPSEIFLLIDPLVSISTAIASRQWVWSLGWAVGILVACVVIPRGFCGYVCPLGTLIDLFDWSVGRRVERFRVSGDGWWVHIKYYLLLGCLLCACFGVLVTGYVAAIPVVTRGFLIVGEPIQTGLLRGWHLVPPPTFGAFVSIVLFIAVLGLGFLRPRFWCKYVCPSGALFSLGNLFRVTERKVESSCINCNKCVEVCPFDAIKPDFTTRVSDCTLCQTCGGVCPTHAIKFVDRGDVFELKVENDPPTGETSLGRRGFLSAAVGTAAAATGATLLTGVTKTFGNTNSSNSDWAPIRPPGSVPESEFLEMCIRCGECFKACPNNVLQTMSFQQGIIGLWTPHAVADWAGCESSCNACGQVCPTGAIRSLPIEEKRYARMGLAIVNANTCLPFAGREACQLCVDECIAAGYDAIEFTQVNTIADDAGQPVEGSGYLAPVVVDDKCVGCGLCQTRCYGINVQERGVLHESAIVVKAGEGREDRMLSGSYKEATLRRENSSDQIRTEKSEFYVPLSPSDEDALSEEDADDPFGLR